MDYVIRLERVSGPAKYIVWLTRSAGTWTVDVMADRHEYRRWDRPTWDGPDETGWGWYPTDERHQWTISDQTLVGLIKQAMATGWAPLADYLAESDFYVLAEWSIEPGWEIRDARVIPSYDEEEEIHEEVRRSVERLDIRTPEELARRYAEAGLYEEAELVRGE